MNKNALSVLAFFLGFSAFAQQFRISDYDGENVTIEYPPSFDGAYLFINQCTNLITDAWEAVDYSQVTLIEGAEVLYSPPEASSESSTTH